jgi:acyl-CoA synthetase (AMP-forming)/AMP-acid ligase II
LQATKAAGHLAGLESMQEFALGPESRADSLAAIFAAAAEGSKLSEEPTPEPRVTFRSLLCFIYTSGTTGMPKPACIKHFRCAIKNILGKNIFEICWEMPPMCHKYFLHFNFSYYSMATGCADSFGLRPTDRLYIPMPLYHTAAGIIGIGQVLLRGSSCAIRARFSASNFWRDCLDYECTVDSVEQKMVGCFTEFPPSSKRPASTLGRYAAICWPSPRVRRRSGTRCG